jgi:hypothetical protein
VAASVSAAGSVGTLTEAGAQRAIEDHLGLDEQQVAAFWADLWCQYLGTANTELIEYARRLRPWYAPGQ